MAPVTAVSVASPSQRRVTRGTSDLERVAAAAAVGAIETSGGRSALEYLYSYGLHIYGLHKYGLHSYGLHGYGLSSYGLYSYDIYTNGLYSYDLYIYMAYIVMTCIVMANMIMAHIVMACIVMARIRGFETRSVNVLVACEHDVHAARRRDDRLRQRCARQRSEQVAVVRCAGVHLDEGHNYVGHDYNRSTP